MDGRQMVFEELIARVSSSPPERTIREIEIRLALVDYEEESFARAFASLDEFELVFFDDLALVFVHHDRIDEHSGGMRPYRLLEPHDLSLSWAAGAAPAELEAMREEARRAASEAPGAARVALLEGMLARRAGDPESAELACRRAVELDPTRATHHNNLGQVLLEGGDAEGALRAFRQAITMDPRSFAAHYNSGLALTGLGRERKARRAFREALRRDPGCPEPHFSLGMLATGTDEARRHLTRALELSPSPELAERICVRLSSLDGPAE